MISNLYHGRNAYGVFWIISKSDFLSPLSLVPITSWQTEGGKVETVTCFIFLDGETVETVSDFIFRGSKITAYWEDVGHLLRPCARGAGRSPALQSQARGVAPILSCQEGPLPTRALPLLLQLLLHFGHRWVQVNLFLYLSQALRRGC